MALAIYTGLVEAKVEMTITDLVCEAGRMDTVRFHHYTHPRNASTGLRYGRLTQRYMAQVRPTSGEAYFSTRGIGLFVERLVENGGGSRTPQAFLYALEFFSVLLGFVYDRVDFKRWKRLADDHAKSAPASVPAPMLDVPTLAYLEEKILQESNTLSRRVTAAKLRMCAQASIRHSDLRSTPLRDLEWCREKGATSTLGIRARAPTTKSGPRPWVVAFLGVRPEHDAWLTKAMELLLESHGTGWETHSFTGCAPSSEDTFSCYPAGLAADVDIIKRMMLDDMVAGVPVPLRRDEIAAFRWHGAKASLPTLMSHFGIQPRVIRHQGAWKKASETMLDLYLREGQVLVLRAQIEVLDLVRKGVAICVLEGAALDPRPCRVEFDATAFRGKAGWRLPQGRAAGVSAEDVSSAMERCSAFRVGGEDGALASAARREASDLAETFRDCSVKGSEELLQETLKLEQDFGRISVRTRLPPASAPSEEVESLTSEDSDDQPMERDPTLEDDELYESLVVLQASQGKVHKPWPGADLLDPARPRCGSVSKNFVELELGEAWDPNYQLCRKCFGPARDCGALCTFVAQLKTGKALCGRRCALSPQGEGGCAAGRHRCDLHNSVG